MSGIAGSTDLQDLTHAIWVFKKDLIECTQGAPAQGRLLSPMPLGAILAKR
jgi:hypothetical protein